MTLDELRSLATVDHPGGYRSWPDPYAAASLSLGEAELLYALVRATKPKLVLELGTGLGVSGRFIAEALVENGDGGLVSVEPLVGIRNASRELLTADLPVAVVSRYENDETPDLVFIDSGPSFRRRDIRRWRGSGALVVVHDAERGYPGLRRGGVLVPTCRGMWVGR